MIFEVRRRHRRARTARYQHVSAALHYLGHCLVGIAADPYDIEHDVSTLDQAGLAQALTERLDERAVIRVGRGPERQETDASRLFGRLRARGERPRHRRRRCAAEQLGEIPPPHPNTPRAETNLVATLEGSTRQRQGA